MLDVQKLRCWSSYRFDYQVFTDLLKSCAILLDKNLGKTLHSHVIKQGHGSCQLVSKALLNMYAKCNALDDCQRLFHQIKYCDTVMWNIYLSSFASSRFHDLKAMSLFRSMIASEGTKVSTVSFAIILPVCARLGCLSVGQSVHCFATKCGLESDTLVGNALVSMYAKTGFAMDAYYTFDGIAEKDVVSWNAIIAGFAENELIHNAFEMFQWMLKCNILPNYATILSILPPCAYLKENFGYFSGIQIHAYVQRRAELATEVFVVNALLSFYLRIGQLKYAKTLFKKMQFKDLVSWNAMIAGYADNGEWFKALELFYELVVKEAITPDPSTLVSILPSCAQLCDLLTGRQIHGYVVRHHILLEDTNVQNALISFYSKCGCREAALKAFLFIPKKDTVSWNAILDCLSENGYDANFVDLLHCMFRKRMELDSVTILTVIRFCNFVSRMDKVKEAHGFSLKYGVLLGDNEPTICNALIDAYAKCGNLDYGYKIFRSMSARKNLVTWNSMISGFVNYGSHEDANMIFQKMPLRDVTARNLIVQVYDANGCPRQALSLFHEMQHKDGVKPDAKSIMSLLRVCAQFGSVNMVRQCHGYVAKACFTDDHLMAALLDTYSKCGNINYAANLFQSETRKDLVLFTAMVGGYATNGMGEEAIQVFHLMLDSGLKPDNVIMTTVLSACSHSGFVDEGLKIFDSMEQVHQVKPSVEQYACLVDLLARGGRIKDAYSFACKMPIEAISSNTWGALLGACTIHHEVEIAQSIVNLLNESNTVDIGNYVAMSNLYAANSSWDGVLEMRRLMRMTDLKKPSGCSWIEVKNSKHEFLAGDYSHPQRAHIYEVLSILDQHIREFYEFFS